VKVLVLTRSTGEGHNRVAIALGEAFTAAGHECQVMDAHGVLGDAGVGPGASLDAGHPKKTTTQPHALTDIASRLYGWAALKAPPLFGAVYKMGEVYTRTPVPSPIYLANRGLAEATYEYIEEHEFDAVVAPHLFPQETLMALRRRHASRARFFAVLTDYTCIPFFSEAKVDGYFIPHPDLAEECQRHGVPPSKTVASGMPTAARFHNPLGRDEARQALGLPADVPLFLVMSGGIGSLKAGDLCARLLTAGGENMHVAVLTGRREDVFLQIAGRYQADSRVSVVPFTNRVPDYMAAADVMLSKPGAVSSTEAAVMGLPLVHTGTIPGNETKNARFFAERGMSVNAPRIDDAVQAAHRLMSDRVRRQQMRDDQRANTFPEAGERVVQQIVNALS